MNGERRILEISSPSSYQEFDRPQHIITISVVGLSGPDSFKGNSGIGKSVLCNRLVRPEYENFYPNHISHLSQADFSGSPVVNNDHWLYWGEAELDEYYTGKTTHLRFIEQTEFIDDETFEPIRSSRQPTDYTKRALRVNLESHDKLMYICRVGNLFKTLHPDAFLFFRINLALNPHLKPKFCPMGRQMLMHFYFVLM